jgi:hypothetical protein
MKTKPRRRPPTLGEFITRVYDTWDQREASGIVRLVIQARWVEFLGPARFNIY